MTFDDEITTEHYQDLLDLSYDRRFKRIVRFGLLIIPIVFVSVVAAIGTFFYAVFAVVDKKGPSGLMMEPWIIGFGVLVTALGLFYLCFSQKNFRLFWRFRKRFTLEDGTFRDGLNLGKATFSLGDDGVQVRMPLDSEHLRWSAFNHFRETADTILMMFNSRVGMVIPKAKLKMTGQLDRARAMILTHVPQKT